MSCCSRSNRLQIPPFFVAMAAAKEKSDDAGDNGAEHKPQNRIGEADTGFRDGGKGNQRHISRSKAAPEDGQVVDKTFRKGVVLLKGRPLQRPGVGFVLVGHSFEFSFIGHHGAAEFNLQLLVVDSVFAGLLQAVDAPVIA